MRSFLFLSVPAVIKLVKYKYVCACVCVCVCVCVYKYTLANIHVYKYTYTQMMHKYFISYMKIIIICTKNKIKTKMILLKAK